jgi:hypothetical protein
MQAALPGAIGHHPAGGFIDDLHLVVTDDVMLVAMKEQESAQSPGDQLFTASCGGPNAFHRLCHVVQPGAAALRQHDISLGQSYGEISAGIEAPREIERLLAFHLLLRRAAR